MATARPALQSARRPLHAARTTRGIHMTKGILLAPLALAAVLSTAEIAHADTFTSWSSIAAGCVPDSATTTAGLASTSAVFGTVGFASGKTGMIRLTCPVTAFSRNSSGANVLLVTYVDPDGASTGCQVRAHLLRTSVDTSGLGNTIVSFDSNTRNTTGRSVAWVSIPEQVNYDANYYWVDLELIRSSSASCNPAGIGVQLTYVIP